MKYLCNKAFFIYKFIIIFTAILKTKNPIIKIGSFRINFNQLWTKYQATFPSKKSCAKRCNTPPASYTDTSSSVSKRQVTGTSII